MNETTVLFHPARLPARDESGFTIHPDLDDPRWERPILGEEYVCTLKLAQAGFEMTERDAELEDPSRDSDNASSCAAWTPPDLTSESFRLVCIAETEDGITAWYVRPVSGAVQAALIAKERQALDDLQNPRSRRDRH